LTPVRRGACGGPAAAERHEQCCGIGKAIGVGLDADDGCGQVGLLRIENGKLIDLTGVELLLNDFETGFCGIFRAPRRFRRAGIRLQGPKCVRDILKCSDDGGAILGFGLIERGFGRVLFVRRSARSRSPRSYKIQFPA
jgi:hypothetical protein